MDKREIEEMQARFSGVNFAQKLYELGVRPSEEEFAALERLTQLNISFLSKEKPKEIDDKFKLFVDAIKGRKLAGWVVTPKANVESQIDRFEKLSVRRLATYHVREDSLIYILSALCVND